MPLVSFSSENKIQQDTSYPLLKLGHAERALIAVIEAEPTVEFVHTLRAPAVGPDGRVIKEERENKNGEKYTTPKMEFFGQHLCFGDFSVVSDKGTDPENCPTCRAAVEGDGVEAPKPRYAMHVIRYGLKPNSWEVRDPFSVSLEAWVFPASKFNSLVDLASDWNLQEHDVKLGPCENKDFQKFDINVSSKAEWRLDESRVQIIKDTYKNNKAPDLSALIARKVDKTRALEDINRVAERIAQAYNTSTATDEHPAVSNTESAADIAASVFSSDKPSTSAEPASETAPAGEPKKSMTLEELMADL